MQDNLTSKPILCCMGENSPTHGKSWDEIPVNRGQLAGSVFRRFDNNTAPAAIAEIKKERRQMDDVNDGRGRGAGEAKMNDGQGGEEGKNG